MAAILPPFPRFVMTILEPISLAAGWLTALLRTDSFITDQYPPLSPLSSTLKILPPTPNAQMLAVQLGNTYMLLGLLGVFILNITTDPRVVKAYVLALAIADIGHVAPTVWYMGWDRTLDIGNWNLVAWGNIAATMILFATRVGYLLGFLGKDRKLGKTKSV